MTAVQVGDRITWGSGDTSWAIAAIKDRMIHFEPGSGRREQTGERREGPISESLPSIRVVEVASDGWIKHDGGPCPVDPDTVVDIRFTEMDPEWGGKAGDYRWNRPPSEFGAVGFYRPVKPAPTKQDGPVRTVTRKEIVPGTYGQVRVLRKMEGQQRVQVELGSHLGYATLSADELRAAASTLIDLAEALEDDQCS